MQLIIPRCPGNNVRSPGVLPWLALVLAALLLSGCGVQHVSLPTSPPRERTAHPAALTLLHDAEQALHAGNTRKADEYLERAIRIDPQNPKVWQGLARSKFQQGLYPQAIQMSLKSNSFRPDRATERSNWLLMEQAYLAMGDAPKAKRAGEKARN